MAAEKAERPNIILILADDLGYCDLSSFGSTAVKTPNLDKLAAGGVKFTQFYAASAVCTPTRASILTGRYPLRFDITRHFADDERHLPRDTVTLPRLLKTAGYLTGHVGKWHLGGLQRRHIADRANSIPGPLQHGFDHYLCQVEEQPFRGDYHKRGRLYRDGGTCLIRNDERVGEEDPHYTHHWTDIVGDEAVSLIDQFHAAGKPFFINVWHLVPHKPYEPAPEPFWSETAAEGITEDQHRFRSMVTHMDAKVGAVVARLEKLGIRDNTLILFASDNGAAYEGQIGELKGGKTDLHEGGLRVPMFVNWPGHVPAGETIDTLAHSNDFLPTLCHVAGVKLPDDLPLDGVDLLPQLKDPAAVPAERGTVLWQVDLYKHLQRHYPKPKPYATEVARRGKWKMLSLSGKPVELFDIQADIAEEKNLLTAEPQIAQELAQEVRQFLSAPRQRH